MTPAQEILNRLGDFWTGLFDAAGIKQVLAVIEAGQQDGARTWLDLLADNLAGEDSTIGYNFAVTYTSADVRGEEETPAYNRLNNRWFSESDTPMVPSGIVESSSPYRVLLPVGVAPISIQTKLGVLRHTEDFLLSGRELQLPRPHTELFDDGVIPILCGEIQRAALLCHALDLPLVLGSVAPITNYFRNDNTLVAFRAAAECVAGIRPFRYDGTLREVIRQPGFYGLWITDREAIQLPPGQFGLVGEDVCAGKTLHSPVRMKLRDQRDDTWWRQAFRGGLPVDTTPGRELRLPYGQVAITWHGTDVNGKPKLRLALDGDAGFAAAYWASAELVGEATNRSLSDVLTSVVIPEAPVSGQILGAVDGIEVFMTYLLDRRALIVGLNASALYGYSLRAVQRFIRDHRPVGCIPVEVPFEDVA